MQMLFTQLLFHFLLLPTHDMSIALIDIHLDESHRITFEIDENDLLSETTLEESALQNYIKEHFQMSINDQLVSIEISDIEKSKDHLIINTVMDLTFHSVSSLEINSDLLMNAISDQSNVVRIYYYEKVRGFRMHSGRKKIVAEY